MGISGLLPLLKSIQVQKHLSEFSGQTLAVDGYVWLHRGTYACATELATGKRTSRYVEYAMQKVRLLRSHGISPYVVLDGGPLPAKRGTEIERNRKRAENLARGNALAAQGRNSEAREYYCKCVDVTPQMAYQLTKALRAEKVPYIVAPYEADAQLAWLELTGVVDGIITEDSDLLVFGCRNVLFKLDAAAATLMCVRREDFGRVPALRGGNDALFRALAILSGCDYLPSVPGVGLKTAGVLLKKHRTAENAIRALRLEGKKDVPKGYLEAFKLAEKVFLHQRVYDPERGQLVHLTDVPAGDEWDAEADAYVGEDVEPNLAKRIATGEADPITRLPIVDINPAYAPRAFNPLPLKTHDLNRSSSTKSKEKGKGPEKAKSESILNFFGPKTKAVLPPKSLSQPVARKIIVGKASGKRTLAEVMQLDAEASAKRTKREPSLDSDIEVENQPPARQSRFFNAVAGPSRSRHIEEPEELETQLDPIYVEDSDDGEVIEVDAKPDPVTQEDGYLSPAPSMTRLDTPDLSSPPRPGRAVDMLTEDFAELVSSPDVDKSAKPRRARSESPLGRKGSLQSVHVLVQDTPTRKRGKGNGPDLRALFGDDDGVEDDYEAAPPQCSFNSAASTQGPDTPADEEGAEAEGRTAKVAPLDVDYLDGLIDVDAEEVEIEAGWARQEIVAQGWWTKWAREGSGSKADKLRVKSPLRRRETTVTPDGRHKAFRFRPHTAPSKSKLKPKASPKRVRLPSRRSLVFSESTEIYRPTSAARIDGGDASVRNRLAAFRHAVP